MSKHVPPVSLRDLADQWPLELLRTTTTSLPGATVQEPKQNETWRYVIGSCVVIGYQASAVIAGSDYAAQRNIEDQIRRKLQPTPEQVQLAHNAASAACSFVNTQIALGIPGPVDLLATLMAFGELDDLGLVLASREITRMVGNERDACWYVQTVIALLSAYRLGGQHGLYVAERIDLHRVQSVGMMPAA